MDAPSGETPQLPDALAIWFRSARLAVLLVLVFVALAALIAGPLYDHALGLGARVKFGAMIAIALAIGFVHFRHRGLAVIVALAPVPAGALALLFTAQQAMTFSPLLLVAFAYVLGFAAALSLADGYVVEAVEGANAGQAIRADWRSEAPALAAVLVLGVVTPAILAFTGNPSVRPEAFLVAWASAASILSALLAVPVAASFGTYDEDFIAQTNRTGERWNRSLDVIAEIVQPRWSASAAGILVVFVTVGAFGSQSLRVTAVTSLTRGEAAAIGLCILLAAAAMAARGWRRMLALAIVAASGLSFCCWGFARAGAVLDAGLLLMALELLALLFVPLSVSAACAARASRSGDDAATASAHAIAKKGPIAILMTIGALLLLAPWYRELGEARLGLVLAVIFASFGALIFLPSLTGVTEALIPRRSKIADRYRVK